MGIAVCYAPGFFIAHLYAKMCGYPPDGFSPPYQWAVIFTSLFFTGLGILLLKNILLRFFADKLCAATLILIVLGTNYLFHAALEGTMPHNFLFSLNCLIILLTMQWHKTFQLKHALLLSATIAFATLCRPTELIWILVPLFWGIEGKYTFIEKMKLLLKNKSQILLSGIVMLLIFTPQFIYWKWASGYWREFNNHSESFSFLSPYTLDFLFSYKKGWFIYTPLMMLAILGFYYIFKNRRALFLSFFLFFLVNLYVVSSWDCWWYAASFSQRPMVEALPIMAIALGHFLEASWLKGMVFRMAVTTCLIGLLFLNLLQTWQYTNGIIDTERMTKAYYWKTFLRTSVSEEDRKLLESDR